MNTNIETKVIAVSQIKPNPKNPKTHRVDEIVASYDEAGYVEPIVLDENDMVLSGHGRLKALIQKNIQEIEVIVKRGLTERQKEKYLLLSNKISENGGWDEKLLLAFDEEILSSVGWESQEIDQLFSVESPEDDFDAESAYQKITEPKVQLGDLFLLGGEVVCPNCNKINKI